MADADRDHEQALMAAMAQVLQPLARLAVAKGLKYPQVQELLKQAFVDQARAADPQSGPRDISRVATTAGLTRREVTRLSEKRPPVRAQRPSPATQVFTRWQADRRLSGPRGKPRALPRLGPAPSFEALARAVTRDVHPRRLLDELLRLGLVEHDAEADTVRLAREAFVPDDQARMVGFLGHNAGDHLAAAVANVIGDERRHFEQALFLDEMSDESVAQAKKLVMAQWRALTAALVPELEDLLAADQAAGRGRRRLRIGLFSYDTTMRNDDAPDT